MQQHKRGRLDSAEGDDDPRVLDSSNTNRCGGDIDSERLKSEAWDFIRRLTFRYVLIGLVRVRVF
jgi:hypothetical protein